MDVIISNKDYKVSLYSTLFHSKNRTNLKKNQVFQSPLPQIKGFFPCEKCHIWHFERLTQLLPTSKPVKLLARTVHVWDVVTGIVGPTRYPIWTGTQRPESSLILYRAFLVFLTKNRSSFDEKGSTGHLEVILSLWYPQWVCCSHFTIVDGEVLSISQWSSGYVLRQFLIH